MLSWLFDLLASVFVTVGVAGRDFIGIVAVGVGTVVVAAFAAAWVGAICSVGWSVGGWICSVGRMVVGYVGSVFVTVGVAERFHWC